ncbi:MAG: 2-oxoglutarate dehydrogenase complex dihydrolipoyllysine-residue succinyltransferase [Armatimonadota bacterium]|nr:2-oxoglutarate dehydrogenase complex dihydrolipoyllysine-residue succinyltransferase [Armatimonadota bacterium]MDR7443466.1 2-oxoglutarate dehydrogenase complex dihydrolipoyllysine-residue succinyltransferase [Armatimonadota bacterium]MDR7569304.1 2-oxoglutarate dehydrogenase complex dihydrolipoyllysine-residue succinyltransferase [Armatimonadota bacterium]MDR7614964.1 2-oxoglutarate dehydrogenase complex dihydrolipoyllysine-residue succinyltransferase [Armatimonadota bacterium]
MAELVVPQMGESVLEATVARWLKREGERVEVGEAVVELETEKVNVEVGAEMAGVLARIVRREGETVRPGEVLGVIEPVSAPEPPRGEIPQPRVAESPPSPPEPEAPTPRATPLARQLATEHGLDLSGVSGTGPGGRITREDVEAAVAAQQPAPVVERPRAPERREERVRMSARRRTIARRLVEAQREAAMLTTFNEVDMTELLALRGRLNERLAPRGLRLGITAFFVKAVIPALREFPRLNAEVQGEEMVLKYYYDIGVAVGDPEGLVVPVVRDADRKSLLDVEREIQAYAEKAAQGRLTPEDLRGGTFTITNGGVFGSLLSTPILNPPQVGILGLHRIEERAVVRAGQVVVRPMMYVALTYDHRLVDGREAVQFLVRIKELVEDPDLLLASL